VGLSPYICFCEKLYSPFSVHPSYNDNIVSATTTSQQTAVAEFKSVNVFTILSFILVDHILSYDFRSAFLHGTEEIEKIAQCSLMVVLLRCSSSKQLRIARDDRQT